MKAWEVSPEEAIQSMADPKMCYVCGEIRPSLEMGSVTNVPSGNTAHLCHPSMPEGPTCYSTHNYRVGQEMRA